MKVLFVTGCTGRGGAGHSLFYLCRYVDRDVIDPLVVMPTEGVIGPKLRDIGVPILVRPRLRERFYELRFKSNNPVTRALSVVRNAWDSVVFVFQLARLAREAEVDAIYGNHMMVKVITAAAGVLSGRPVFLHCRTIYSNAVERLLYVTAARIPKVLRIIAVSNASAKNFEAIADKVRVVRNGVPVADIIGRAEELDARRAHDIAEGRPVIGFVGRFVGWKGIDVFFDAAEAVGKDHPEVMFLLVGDVPVGAKESIEDYRTMARNRGMEGQVVFAGFQSNPAPYLKIFDALVVPSVSPDPCPRVVVESMALGTLVIGSNAGGIPEVVKHESNGLLVPPRDAGALATQIRRIVTDPELRDRLSEEGARNARDEYDASSVAAKIQHILTDAMKVDAPSD